MIKALNLKVWELKLREPTVCFMYGCRYPFLFEGGGEQQRISRVRATGKIRSLFLFCMGVAILSATYVSEVLCLLVLLRSLNFRML